MVDVMFTWRFHRESAEFLRLYGAAILRLRRRPYRRTVSLPTVRHPCESRDPGNGSVSVSFAGDNKRSLIDLAACYPGGQDLILPDVFLGHPEVVISHQDKVGGVAGQQSANHVFLVGCPGCPLGEQTQGLIPVELFARQPAPGGLLIMTLARHRGVQAEEGVCGLHGEIGAARQMSATVKQLAPGIGARQSRVAEPVAGHILVAGGVGRLNGRHRSRQTGGCPRCG